VNKCCENTYCIVSTTKTILQTTLPDKPKILIIKWTLSFGH